MPTDAQYPAKPIDLVTRGRVIRGEIRNGLMISRSRGEPKSPAAENAKEVTNVSAQVVGIICWYYLLVVEQDNEDNESVAANLNAD